MRFKKTATHPLPPQQRRLLDGLEDCLHFVETFGLYVFTGDVLPTKLRPLWAQLVPVIQHYFRPRPADETVEQFRAAAKRASIELSAYAVALERLLEENPTCAALQRLFTINLHIAVCRLYRQEVELGSTSGMTDLPVERVMQSVKRDGGRMVTQAPEKVYAQRLCLVRHAAKSLGANGSDGAPVLTAAEQLDKLVARRRANHNAPQYDQPGSDGLLLGAAVSYVYTSKEADSVLTAFGQMLQYHSDAERRECRHVVEGACSTCPGPPCHGQRSKPEGPHLCACGIRG
ncbi:hypothetical protein PLESTM_001542600 [Pleodorina starrii]|nr:hypothetical protein PLESTM_001542600 [Pleodorina starrii]